MSKLRSKVATSADAFLNSPEWPVWVLFKSVFCCFGIVALLIIWGAGFNEAVGYEQTIATVIKISPTAPDGLAMDTIRFEHINTEHIQTLQLDGDTRVSQQLFVWVKPGNLPSDKFEIETMNPNFFVGWVVLAVFGTALGLTIGGVSGALVCFLAFCVAKLLLRITREKNTASETISKPEDDPVTKAE